MNEQQINQLTDLIYDENPVGVRDFILATLPDAATRQGFILGEQSTALFREAEEEGKISSAQAMHDLLPDVDLQRQLLKSVGTLEGREYLDNSRSVFGLILTYGSPELVTQEIYNSNADALLDLVLNDVGIDGLQDAVNFNKQEVVKAVLSSLESQDDRLMLIRGVLFNDNLDEDQSAANIVETMLDALDFPYDFILNEVGMRFFESLVFRGYIDTVNLMLDSLEDDEQKQYLVSGIVRNREDESEEMQEILDAFQQEELASDGSVSDGGYESYEGGTPNSETSNEEFSVHSEDEADLVIADPVNAQTLNIQGNILDNFDTEFPPAMFAEAGSELEGSESEGEEVNNEKRALSRSPSPRDFKKYKPSEHDKEGGQGV